MSKVMTPYSNNGDIAQFVPVEENQLVDLDATYAELEGAKSDDVRSGLESYLEHGKLGRKHLEVVGYGGCESVDPIISSINAVRAGGQFLNNVISGFRGYIKLIIEYINRGINWCLARAKNLLGFTKSFERIKQANQIRGAIDGEIIQVLNKLGGDTAKYSFEEFVKSAPADLTKIEVVKFIKNKSDDDIQTITRLRNVLPIMGKLATEVEKANTSVTKEKDIVEKLLNQCKRDFKNNSLTTNSVLVLSRAYAEFGAKALNLEPMMNVLSGLIEALTDINFSNVKELNKNLLSIRNELKQKRDFVTQKYNKNNIDVMYRMVGELTVEVMNTDERTLDISKVDPKVLKDFIKLDDADAIKAMAELAGEPNLIGLYTLAGTSVRDFVNALELTMKFFQEIQLEIENVCRWKAKCDAYLQVESLNSLSASYIYFEQNKAQGVDLLDGKAPVNHKYGMDFGMHVKDGIQQLLGANFKNIKTKVNNFSRQVGLGVQVK